MSVSLNLAQASEQALTAFSSEMDAGSRQRKRQNERLMVIYLKKDRYATRDARELLKNQAQAWGIPD
jgi:hypothetical protein